MFFEFFFNRFHDTISVLIYIFYLANKCFIKHFWTHVWLIRINSFTFKWKLFESRDNFENESNILENQGMDFH